jgi:hypothetical protein
MVTQYSSFAQSVSMQILFMRLPEEQVLVTHPANLNKIKGHIMEGPNAIPLVTLLHIMDNIVNCVTQCIHPGRRHFLGVIFKKYLCHNVI